HTSINFEPFSNQSPAADVGTDFIRRAIALANKLLNSSFESPMLILLDEVERILPSTVDSAIKVEEFNAFFGSLRALSQQQRQIGLLVADVHPDCNRINHWAQDGLPTNPVNQFFKEIFLQPFSEKETSNMINNIGRLMGRSFDAQTLAAIHEGSGGHPFV